MYCILGFSLFLTTFSFSKAEPSGTSLPNSCIGLTDDYHLLRLTEDGPIIKQKCSNEYMVLDYSIDNDITDYFTSWNDWHWGLSGPTKSDSVNWQEWFIPNDGSKYLISPDCNECDDSEYSLNQAYYLNANMFGCFGYGRGYPVCDWDYFTYECRACLRTEFSGDKIDRVYSHVEVGTKGSFVGECGVNVESVARSVPLTYEDCQQSTVAYKPSIGINGQHCVCVKPTTIKHYSATQDEITEKLNNDNTKTVEETSNNDKDNDNTYYLYQTDFDHGTYRITKPGTYKIMENIVFDFKANYENPNADGAWFPTTDDINEYPGSGQARDGYYLGFFAGITIETDNVEIDLNDHELKQSFAFFIQQGFFSIIECGSQPFMPGQGIGFFGAHPVLPSNIVIKNGVLGLSSHHGIHGNYNKNIQIQNVIVKDFATHGIQLNGFENAILSDVEVGPTTQLAYMTAAYTHGRLFLSIAKQMSLDDTVNTIRIPFNNHQSTNGITIGEIADELNDQLDIAFNYILNKYNTGMEEEIDENIKSLFIKSNGIPYGSSMYGIFLNYPGASIVSYHLNDKTSQNVVLSNVYVHDIVHETEETIGLKNSKRAFSNPFDSVFKANDVFGLTKEDLTIDMLSDSSLKYNGNILNDLYFALYYLTSNWDYLGLMYVEDEFFQWSINANSKDITDILEEYMCNGDSMSHSLKGTFGIRIDGVKNATLTNIKIENMKELADVGSLLCGEYDTSFFSQHMPYQTGYSGNMIQGISIDYSDVTFNQNIKINNIQSMTGLSVGINLWYGSNIYFNNNDENLNIQISNIIAGYNLALNSYEHTSRPNKAPESCAIRVTNLLDETFETKQIINYNNIDENNNNVFDINCIVGHIGCNDDENTLTNIGNIQESANDVCANTIISSSSNQNETSSNSYLFLLLIAIIFIISVITIFVKYYFDNPCKVFGNQYKYSSISLH